VPVGAWLRTTRPAYLAYAALLALTVHPMLELWGTPRVWPLQVQHLLMRAGYRPDLKRRIDERVAAIVANPGSDWRDPISAR
jgi:hypothetical protein